MSASNVAKYTDEILAANSQWAKKMNQVFPEYFPDLKGKQAPKILWIGCSDSRIQESDATNSLPGTVFVHRNIANQFHLDDDNALSVFAYALGELNVQHVVIVGHEHCGGCITAIKEAQQPSHPDGRQRHHTVCDSLYHAPRFARGHGLFNEIHDMKSKNPHDALTRWLTPLVDLVRKTPLPDNEEAALKVVVEVNVKMQVDNVAKLKDFVRESAKTPVWVHGWVYDFSTGFIRDLKVTRVLGA